MDFNGKRFWSPAAPETRVALPPVTCSRAAGTYTHSCVSGGRGSSVGRWRRGGLPVQIVVLGLVRCGELSGPARSRHCRYDFPAAMLDKAPTLQRWVVVTGAATVPAVASARLSSSVPAGVRSGTGARLVR
jgi:hypothetical protein